MDSSEDLVGGVIAPVAEGKESVSAERSPNELRSLRDVEAGIVVARGPNRDLDLAVANINIDDGKPWYFTDARKETVTRNQYGRGAIGNPVCGLEYFTRTIDDAAEFLPPGWEWLKRSPNVFSVYDDSIDYEATKTWAQHIEAYAATPALSLLLAATRARIAIATREPSPQSSTSPAPTMGE